jgi:hypothetical protein
MPGARHKRSPRSLWGLNKSTYNLEDSVVGGTRQGAARRLAIRGQVGGTGQDGYGRITATCRPGNGEEG